AKDFANVGDSIEAVVLNADSRERRISLSVKSLAAAAEKAEFESYLGGGQGEATSNLGDLLKSQMDKAR
ncbi:MAG: 30S ribosomal protein S1, partial [Trichlorobacter sp.]|nr:30S ribosomal protein S1 [Trichlorobacter sp.]